MSQTEYFNALARALAANAALPPCAKLSQDFSNAREKKRLKISVAVTSDLHCDMRANADAMEAYARGEIAKRSHDDSDSTVRVLVVAGDVGTSLESITRTLSSLRRCVDALCYLPAGNHELWTSNAEKWASDDDATPPRAWYPCDSLGKLIKLIDVCTALDVRCTPTSFGSDVVVCPTYGWYSDDFDGCDREYTQVEARFDAAARWPSWIDAENPRNSHARGIGRFLSSLNAHNVKTFLASSRDIAPKAVRTLVTYSHFIPRVELYRGTPSLLKVMGSKIIDDDARAAARAFGAPPKHVHCFGHSHLNVDTAVDGVRYVQCALGYPSERWFGINYPKIVHSTD